MKKTTFLLIAIFLLLSSCSKDDPDRVLQRAGNNFEKGRYEQALQDHIWFHDNALKYEPSLYGVRLSYALADWIRLSEKYPAALEKLKEIRDNKTEQIKNGKGSFHLFHDVESINDHLNRSSKTVELYKDLIKIDFNLAKECYRVAKEPLIDHGEFEICNRFVPNPLSSLTSMKEGLTVNIRIYKEKDWAGQEHLEWAIDDYLIEAEQILLILTKNDRRDEAKRFINEASKDMDIKEILYGLQNLNKKYLANHAMSSD